MPWGINICFPELCSLTLQSVTVTSSNNEEDVYAQKKNKTENYLNNLEIVIFTAIKIAAHCILHRSLSIMRGNTPSVCHETVTVMIIVSVYRLIKV